jgi:hypothetical protein
MPRLVPRLLKAIGSRQILGTKQFIPIQSTRRRRPSLFRPIPEPSSACIDRNRRSIILFPTNEITQSRSFQRHKRLPPKLHVNQSKQRLRDPPREMTEEERRWWSDPYRSDFFLRCPTGADRVHLVRMISTPIRKCCVTNALLPTGKRISQESFILQLE